MEQFSQLTPAEKVEAVLAAENDPLSQQLALKWAGVDLDSLSEQDTRSVEAIFKRWQMTKSESPLYYVPDASKHAIIERIGVDITTVQRRIANLGLEMWGIPAVEE